MADKEFKCPIEEIIEEKNISNVSEKELWYLKRNHCLYNCKKGCDMLTILKKIYWEIRKS